MDNESMISPQEIVKKYDISYQTVNHYTNLGLLIVRGRKGNGRLYDKEEVAERLKKVVRLKSEGYPLRLIRKMM